MIKFVNAKYDSVLPGVEGEDFAEEDKAFVKDVDEILKQYVVDMDQQKIRSGLVGVMQLSGRGNQYIQDNKVDNALLASNPARCAQVVLITINLIYTLASIVHPFMPAVSDSILQQLDATPRSIPEQFSIDLLPGHKISTAEHLFARINPDKIAEWRKQFGGNSSSTTVEEPVLSKKQLEKNKKAAAKVLAEAEALRVRTPEESVLEEKVKGQGEIVRRVKIGEGEGDITVEVGKLQELKAELRDLVVRQQLEKTSL